ncbi:uncharacterized protein [Bemisia tabaci]|uniref:uncharacterized protein n=1 Tax=Bemisia tabaci TaxID=7038 RepID=UPI003B28D538
MDFPQIHVIGVLLTLLVCQILRTSQNEDDMGQLKIPVNDLTESFGDEGKGARNALVRRERRILPLLLGGLGLGLAAYGYHKWKEYHPCRYYNWGPWESLRVKHRIKANGRCTKYFDHVRDKIADAGKCTNIARAACVKISGDTTCAAVLTDGSVRKLSTCV